MRQSGKVKVEMAKAGPVHFPFPLSPFPFALFISPYHFPLHPMITLIRSEIARALSRRISSAFAVVTSVDWARQLARVRMATSGQETGWLRIAASAAGLLRPIKRGDEVKVTFLDGNPAGAGVIDCVLFGAARPPDLPENCFGAVQGDAKILFDANGKVTWSSVSTVSISSTSSISIDGTQVSLAGGSADAVRFAELEAALNALVATIATHTHNLILTAPGTPTGPPVPPPTLVLAPARALKVKVT